MVKITIIHNTTTIENGVEYTKALITYNDKQVVEVKKRKTDVELNQAMEKLAKQYNIPELEIDKVMILMKADNKQKAIALVNTL